jgi:PUA domain protein
MGKEFQIKKRRPVRRKNIAPLLKDLEEALDIDLNVDGGFLEMATYGSWQLVFVDKIAKTIEISDDEGQRWAFLTLRGFLEHPDANRWVAVDHGAIPFLMNGADCMVAGVHAADESIEVGDLVWIRDKEHGRPLALGWATMSGAEMVEATKGKGIKTLHWVGDELWDMEAKDGK